MTGFLKHFSALLTVAVSSPHIVSTSDCFSVEAFSKEIEGAGMHRKLTYNIVILVDSTCSTPLPHSCKWFISDHVSQDFYIDREETRGQGFGYLESSVMSIESINSEATPYEYALSFVGGGGQTRVHLHAELPYHLRYAEANPKGYASYALHREFTLATNCFSNKQSIPPDSIPKLISSLDAPVSHLVKLGEDLPALTLTLPAGNTSHNTFWLSTTLAIYFGSFLLLFSLFWKDAKKNFLEIDFRLKQKVD